LRDMRDRDPVAVQVRPGKLLDARERFRLDGAELGEIDFRPGWQIERQGAAARFGTCGCWCGARHAAGQRAFDERLHIAVQDARFRAAALHLREIDAELARELAYRRAGVRLGTGLLARRRRHGARGGPRGGAAAAGGGGAGPAGRVAAAAPAGAGAALGASAFGAGRGSGPRGSARCSAPSSTRIGAPCDTLSPVLIFSSLTTPAAGDGISMVALSDSSVTSDCSFATLSPGLTSTSITSTSLKSPISGTPTVCVPLA